MVAPAVCRVGLPCSVDSRVYLPTKYEYPGVVPESGRPRRTVAVVGGGCSGALVAYHLLCLGYAHVTLIDPGQDPGRGLAYGVAEPWHLLNSPAGAMSVRSDRPMDFVDWARDRVDAVEPGSFLPRRLYGAYVTERLDAAAEANPGRLRLVRDRAVALREGLGTRMAIVGESGGAVLADDLVLATGHGPAAPLWATAGQDRHEPGDGARPGDAGSGLAGPGAAGSCLVADPWRPGALDAVPPDRPVLLVGTGLTAVDVTLSLVNRGMRAPVHAVSRHGLLPQPHRGAAGRRDADWATGHRTLGGLFRAVRRQVGETGDWRTVVDSIRPHADAIWRGLESRDRERFLRHATRHWEVHRHRMPPPVAATVQQLRDEGALVVERGRLATLTPSLEATIRLDTGTVTRRYGAVVNCTGPGSPADNGFVTSLIDAGLARRHELGLGLDVDVAGALIDVTGRAALNRWALGPLRRGCLWETTAVPEIRGQAERLGRFLAACQPFRTSSSDAVLD